ncbi:hypothetical protein B0H16DRAFT_776061 [Mycena metata]|uniref:Uncharacterized protein n=1 Tax=Mycena metata TaxID=1033252 RepID=A0AAD7J1L0_9AGAR|nr:hypothetical protein B0H16DRAFT_776061 [Mycena metata]
MGKHCVNDSTSPRPIRSNMRCEAKDGVDASFRRANSVNACLSIISWWPFCLFSNSLVRRIAEQLYTLSCNPATPTPLPATRVAISHVTSILQAANTSAVSPPALQFGTGGALRERLDIPARDRLDANYGMDSFWVNPGVNTNQHDLLVPPLGAFIGLAPQVLSCPCFYAVSDSLLLGDIGQSLTSGEHAIFPCALCGAPASTSRERGPSSTPPALHRCRSTVRAPRA